MRNILTTATLLFACAINCVCFAQAKEKTVPKYNNAVFLELGGPGLFYSIGYERTWYSTPRFAAMTGVGISYLPYLVNRAYIEPGVLFRHRNVALEFGMAIVRGTNRSISGNGYSTPSGVLNSVFLVPRIGIRVFTNNQRVFFRAGFTPNILLHENNSYSGYYDREIKFGANIITIGIKF